MKSLKVTRKVINGLSDKAKKNYILKGLQRNGIAFINAAPDTGKSYLSLSIAIECATSLELLGLKLNSDPLKVAYWPAEDNVQITGERLEEILDNLSDPSVESIAKNFTLIDSSDPICCTKKASAEEQHEVSSNKAALINELKSNGTQVLIIDTVRSAIGSADEVDDDYQIKKSVVDIATAANCAIFLVHHVTKAVAQGKVSKSAVSQSGLSILGSFSKLHLMLHIENIKGELKTVLSFSKANYLKPSDKKSIALVNEHGLLKNPSLATLVQKPVKNSQDTKESIKVKASSVYKKRPQNEASKPVGNELSTSNTPAYMEITPSFADNNDLYTDEQRKILRMKQEKASRVKQ